MSDVIKKFMKNKLKEVGNEALDFIKLIDKLEGLEEVYSIKYIDESIYYTVGRFVLKTGKQEFKILLQYKPKFYDYDDKDLELIPDLVFYNVSDREIA